jgi:hypothetical protein
MICYLQLGEPEKPAVGKGIQPENKDLEEEVRMLLNARSEGLTTWSSVQEKMDVKIPEEKENLSFFPCFCSI